MNEGARTLDNLDHNQGLYQLSYVHHKTHKEVCGILRLGYFSRFFKYFKEARFTSPISLYTIRFIPRDLTYRRPVLCSHPISPIYSLIFMTLI